MPTIRLTNSVLRAVVDPQDAHLADLTWSLATGGYVQGWYKGAHVYLQRVIAGARKGQEVSFKNRCKTDCRRRNLKIVNGPAANPNRASTTGFRGISVIKRSNSYRVDLPGGEYVGQTQSLTEAKRLLREAKRKAK